MNLKEKLREVPDFPEKGILFKDITPLLQDIEAFDEVIDIFIEEYSNKEFDYIAAIEARGFLLGPVLSRELKKGFIPIRKPGKLPCDKITATYELEYGQNTLEIHTDAINPGDKVLLIDDLLATGGTSKAAIELIERLEGDVVSAGYLIELVDLAGRDNLQEYEIFSIMKE